MCRGMYVWVHGSLQLVLMLTLPQPGSLHPFHASTDEISRLFSPTQYEIQAKMLKLQLWVMLWSSFCLFWSWSMSKQWHNRYSKAGKLITIWNSLNGARKNNFLLLLHKFSESCSEITFLLWNSHNIAFNFIKTSFIPCQAEIHYNVGDWSIQTPWQC